MAVEPGVRGVEWPLRAERERTDSVTVMLGARPVLCSALISVRNDVGLRGAVEPELVIEVELSSWSWGPRRLINEVWRGTEDLFSGLRDPPSDALSRDCLATLRG